MCNLIRTRARLIFRSGSTQSISIGEHNGSDKKKVLLIGIDGCCPEAIMEASTPQFDELCANGAYNFNTHSEKVSISGPGWTSILTGFSQENHGVLDNSFDGYESERFPTFLSRLKSIDSEARTTSIVAWSPINDFLCTNVDNKSDSKSDDDVVTQVCNVLASDKADAIFIQLDAVDAAGHAYGYESSEYMNAVSKADVRLGKIMEALRARPHYSQEDWLLVITTDHGGWEKGHEEDLHKNRRTFCILHGSNIKQGEFSQPHSVIDIAPTIMKHLEIEIQADWNLDGSIMDVFKIGL